MEQKARLHASRQWVGEPVYIGDGYAEVEFFTFSEMAVEVDGTVNNGFIFGLGEFAAAIAVNIENVFIERAEVEFLKPVRIGERVEATGRVVEKKGERYIVEVEAKSFEGVVMRGRFWCRVEG